jgi:hypothetical protein
MRALALLTALLMLLSPLAAANEGDGQGDGGPDDGSGSGGSGSGSGSNSTSGGPAPDGNSTGDPDDEPSPGECPMPERRPATEEEVRSCKERFCEERPRDPSCRRERDDREREAADNESAERGPREWQRWCRPEAREDEGRDRCRAELARFGDAAEGRWISFRVDAANATLLDYRVAGLPALDSLHLVTGSDNLTVRASGSALRLGDEDTALTLHDDPTGLVRFKADDGSLLLQLPEGTAVDRTEDGSTARLTYGDGRIAHLRAGNATWLDGRTVLAEGFAAVLVHPPEEKRPGEDGAVQEAKAEVQQAVVDRKVGAEITLHGPAARSGAMAYGPTASPVEVLEYDDLKVDVRLPAAAVATPEAPIRIEVSAELDEGRTIVLNVNRSLLEATDPRALVLRYFDLHEQADGSVVETEVVFAEAAGLRDILDPTDDSGQPEYWVVQDSNGLQLLASVPHWSAHAITIGSLAVLAVSPNVMLGIAVGVAGSVVAAAAMLWPRRRDDE